MPDVVVLGASVAGLAAARAAAQGGAHTVIVERRSNLHEAPPPASVAFEALWPEPHELRLAVRQRYHGVVLRGTRSRVRVQTKARFYDRALLDARLATLAEDAGAHVLFGARVAGRDRSTLTIDGKELRAAIVIFADGPESLGPRLLGSLRDPAGMRWGTAWRVEFKPPKPHEIEVSVGPHVPGGRTQFNPVPEFGIFWMFRRSARTVPHPPDAALAPHPSLADLPSSRIKPLAGPVADPVFALPGTLVARGMMAVGGAAGQGGIELGHEAGTMAGEAAARAIRRGDVARASLHRWYEEPWKKKRETPLLRFRRAYDRLGALTHEEWERILAPWDGETIPLDELRSVARSGFGRAVTGLRFAFGRKDRAAALLFAFRKIAR